MLFIRTEAVQDFFGFSLGVVGDSGFEREKGSGVRNKFIPKLLDVLIFLSYVDFFVGCDLLELVIADDFGKSGLYVLIYDVFDLIGNGSMRLYL